MKLKAFLVLHFPSLADIYGPRLLHSGIFSRTKQRTVRPYSIGRLCFALVSFWGNISFELSGITALNNCNQAYWFKVSKP